MIGTRVRVLFNREDERIEVIGTIVRIVGHLYEVELPDGELRLYALEGLGRV